MKRKLLILFVLLFVHVVFINAQGKICSTEVINKIKQLNAIAVARSQSLAQMSIAWLMKDKRVTSVLIGASSVKQLDDNLACLNKLYFTVDELNAIETILNTT